MRTVLHYDKKSIRRVAIGGLVGILFIIYFIYSWFQDTLAGLSTPSSIRGVLGAIILTGVIWLIVEVTRYVILSKRNFLAISVNDERTGLIIFLNNFPSRSAFVAFDWLTVKMIDQKAILTYKHATMQNNRGGLRLLGHGQLVLSHYFFDQKELIEFAKTLQALKSGNTETLDTIAEEAMAKDKAASPLRRLNLRMLVKNPILLVSVILMALMITTAVGQYINKKRYVEQQQLAFHHTEVNYHRGDTLTTRLEKIRINHVYSVKNSSNVPVLVFNITLKDRHKDPDGFPPMASADDFMIFEKWSKPAEKEFKQFDEGSSNTVAYVMINNRAKRVIDVYNEGQGAAPMPNGMSTFNIVVKNPQTSKFDFEYAGFNATEKFSASAGDDSSIVYHMKKTDLESLK